MRDFDNSNGVWAITFIVVVIIAIVARKDVLSPFLSIVSPSTENEDHDEILRSESLGGDANLNAPDAIEDLPRAAPLNENSFFFSIDDEMINTGSILVINLDKVCSLDPDRDYFSMPYAFIRNKNAEISIGEVTFQDLRNQCARNIINGRFEDYVHVRGSTEGWRCRGSAILRINETSIQFEPDENHDPSQCGNNTLSFDKS